MPVSKGFSKQMQKWNSSFHDHMIEIIAIISIQICNCCVYILYIQVMMSIYIFAHFIGLQREAKRLKSALNCFQNPWKILKV